MKVTADMTQETISSGYFKKGNYFGERKDAPLSTISMSPLM